MIDVDINPQPGSPKQAPRMLPLGAFGTFLLLGGIFCILATLGFAWLAKGIFADQFITFDDGVITWLHGYWGPTIDQIMLFFTTIGGPVVLGLFITLAAAALLRVGRWIDAAGLVLAAAGGGLLNQLLKEIFRRVRPALVPSPFHLTSYSFPSGHAMGSIVCYGMLAYIGIRLVRSRLGKLALALAATLTVLGVGLSRVYFGVHYPTDIAGGYLAGAVWLAIAIGVVEAAERQARRHQRMSVPEKTLE